MRQLRAEIYEKNLFYATIIQFMQKQNAISENQKHSTENTLKGAYQLKKNHLSESSQLMGSSTKKWKFEKPRCCNWSLSPDAHSYFTTYYFSYRSS